MTTYGKDTSCTSTLSPGQIVTGVRLVAEAAYRRLTTPRGMLRGGEDEGDYGLDLLDLVGSIANKADVAAVPGRVRNELLKDERIVAVEVVATPTTLGPVTTLTLDITATTSEGPFSLQLGVDDVSVQLIGIAAE